jgi:hypothetical protein
VGGTRHLGYGRQVGAFGWAELVALLTSIGFGTVSAVIPIVNAEAYIIASQMSAVAGPIPIAIGIAIGQTVGKLLLFFGVREGKELPFSSSSIGVRPESSGPLGRRGHAFTRPESNC